MNRSIIIVGLIVAVVGVGGYVDSTVTHLILPGTHHTIPLAGIAITVLGALLAVGGLMMGGPARAAATQFKCPTCGAVFGTQTALDQHTKAKHTSQPSNP